MRFGYRATGIWMLHPCLLRACAKIKRSYEAISATSRDFAAITARCNAINDMAMLEAPHFDIGQYVEDAGETVIRASSNSDLVLRFRLGCRSSFSHEREVTSVDWSPTR